MYSKTFGIFLLSLMILAGCISAPAQKMSAEEIIAKHVASIGKKEMIADSKKIMVIGGSDYEILTAPVKATGRAVLASDGNNVAFFSSFNLSDYRKERIGLFDNKIDIPFIVPGRRSVLGTFLATYDKFLENRLFGGAMFSSWVFLGPESARGKLETEGKKKVGNREAWVVSYTPKGGLKGGGYIKLYFDAENFHHLRTVYYQKETDGAFAQSQDMRAGGGGTVFTTNTSGAWGGEMDNNGVTLTEDFEDIRSAIGLVLPHKYTVLVAANLASGTSQQRWRIAIEEYRLIKEFPPETFRFSTGSE